MQTTSGIGRNFKLVYTLHDLIYYRHPTPPPSFNVGIRALWRVFHLVYWPQRMLLNRADAVATVSQTTKDLISKHRLTKRPVSVVYNAAETAEKPRIERNSAPSKKLVYMGSFMDYKNVEVLVAGMKHLHDYELHLLSKITPERRREIEALVSHEGGAVVFHNGVSEAEYHQQLDAAVALVTGSRDEGFGIPLVEAMSRGIPAVVSNIEIFREIGDDAAIYFDQESPESFAQAVKQLESNPRWLEVSAKSIRRAHDFNWDKSAADLIELINQLKSE